MVLIVVKAVPSRSKPPAADGSMRTSSGGIYGFGAPAPSVTRASPMHFLGDERSSAILPKLVKFVGPSWTQAEEEVSICYSALRTLASFCVCFYVCLRGEMWLLKLMLQSC